MQSISKLPILAYNSAMELRWDIEYFFTDNHKTIRELEIHYSNTFVYPDPYTSEQLLIPYMYVFDDGDKLVTINLNQICNVLSFIPALTAGNFLSNYPFAACITQMNGKTVIYPYDTSGMNAEALDCYRLFSSITDALLSSGDADVEDIRMFLRTWDIIVGDDGYRLILKAGIHEDVIIQYREPSNISDIHPADNIVRPDFKLFNEATAIGRYIKYKGRVVSSADNIALIDSETLECFNWMSPSSVHRSRPL